MGNNLSVNNVRTNNNANVTNVKYIHKAKIDWKNERFFFKGSDGRTYMSKAEYENSYPERILKCVELINKYFTKESPDITPKEQVQLMTDLMKTLKYEYGIGGINTMRTENRIELMRAMIDTFSKEASEGGKNITQNEIYQMYEILGQNM